MDAIGIELKNYRCFSDQYPLRFRLVPGCLSFVGPNNAGKSTALRFFYEFRRLFSQLVVDDVPANTTNDTRHLWTGSNVQFLGFPPPVRDPNEIFFNGNNRPLTITFRFSDSGERALAGIEITVHRPVAGQIVWTLKALVRIGGEYVEFNAAVHGIGALSNGRWLTQEGNLLVDIRPLIDAARLMSGALYIGAFRNAIHTGTSDTYYDLQIGQAFINSWRSFKTGNVLADNLAAAKVTQDIKDVFRFDQLEINPSASGETLQLFVDGKSYILSELGASLTQFVIILTFVAVRRPSMVLIDEPELNLHPLLQQDLLAGVRAYCDGPIVFATHNLGLARAVSQEIYVCQKMGSECRAAPILGHPRLAELLGELSFGGYQELGFSKLLLVEGPHDVTAIRELLRHIGRDHEILLLPLGGASMINGGVEEQLHELTRITRDIAALVDSERVTEEDDPASNVVGFRVACESAGVTCHVLHRRAFENYLPTRAIEAVKGPGYAQLAPFQRLSDASPRWSKAENAVIARSMSAADLDGTDLGEFLLSL